MSASVPGTIAEFQAALRKKEISPTELALLHLDRIQRLDGAIGAFLHVDEKAALNAAETAPANSDAAPLAGIPIGLKDLLATKDMPTTCASKILEGYRPPYDATVVEKLRAGGVVFPGKLNMDEFAMGSSNETSAYKPCRNPWDLARVPGGSSGGSAAAVAAGLVPAALGSDTGGSIRQPGSHCGVTALKPTYGRVSRFGLVAFASSLDQIGTFTRDARDAAIIMNAISGHDARDTTSASVDAPDFTKALAGDVKGLRLGVPREYFGEGLDAAVGAKVQAAMKQLEKAGATLVDISLPHTKYAVAVYYLVAPSEASSNLARFDGIRFGLRVPAETLVPTYKKTRGAGFGPEVKRRIMLGTYCLSAGYYEAFYLKALKVRTLIQRDFIEAFRTVDAIVTPTSPSVAFKEGEKSANPLEMYFSDIYTISVNLAGLPGISVPCGFATPPDGGTDMPVGLQIIGKAFDEGGILRIADAYQRLTDWHTRRPPL